MTMFHPRTRTLLAKAGLAPIELMALDHAPRHQVPDARGGFGLIGPTGTGKSWTMVLHVARLVEHSVCRQPDPTTATLLWVDGDVARDGRLLWVCWYDQAESIRRRRFEKVWVDSWAEHAEDIPLLVLDDIGREPCDGANDSAREVLGRVLEHRYRFQLPVFWTSNRTREELTAFYGGPLASRIFGTWPDYEATGNDLRLTPPPQPSEFKKAAGGDQ